MMDRLYRASAPLNVYKPGLAESEGVYLCSAGAAVLKAALESELAVSLIALPNDPAFASLLDAQADPVTRDLLEEHFCRVDVTESSARAVRLAGRAGRSGRCAVALVPNDQLDRSMPELTAMVGQGLARGGAACVILEDRPSGTPASCPRRAAARLGLATLEPVDLRQFREMISIALRMSRGGALPAVIVVHDSILRSIMTIEMRPNRVGKSVTILRADRRRQRRLRFSESRDALRLAQRLELNAARALPNPGEQVPIGFVTIGPADAALRHLTEELHLHGRVPTLALGLLNPLDETALKRLLTRCDRVVVLESRPGSMELMLLDVAEQLRHGGAAVATIWGRALPADGDNPSAAVESASDLHPSILVRKTQHLLLEIRPTLKLVDELAPPPPTIELDDDGGEHCRKAELGAEAFLYSQLHDLERWLQRHSGDDDEANASAILAIDGVQPKEPGRRVVVAEVLSRAAFLEHGIGALAYAAATGEPWLMLICDLQSRDDQDLDRLVKSAIPSRHTDRVRVRPVDIKATVELREALREAARGAGLTVLLIRDASPSRFDGDALVRELRDVDRLGFKPVQRVRWSAEQACSIRPSALRLPAGEVVSADATAVQTDVRVDVLPERLGTQFRARMRLLDEVVEVNRTRAPVPFWRGDETVALPAGRPVHANQSHWRAHCAGLRGAPPGIAVRVLCEAGRMMGYDVQCISDTAQERSGSWSQVLFNRVESNRQDVSLSATIPFGEADVLLGLHGRSTLSALSGEGGLQVGSPRRTYLIANTGAFAEETHRVDSDVVERALHSTFDHCVRSDISFLQNIAAACREGFYSDRVTDVVLLGVAFQCGLIPVTYSAMASALRTAEASGVGRVTETFDFGRRLANEPQLLSRPRMERLESVNEMRRRMRLSLSKRRWRGRRLAARFDSMVESCLRGMPGLTETDAGRQARRDLTAALYRCLLWGGPGYAERYADLIVQLYHVDRGDTGRALTRFAVLPLAQAMLILDPWFVAAMTTSPEHRRRIRQQLNVKPARGDRVLRRYLLRLEFSIMHKRYRADVRASDWIPKAMSALRSLVPSRFRGSARDRTVREAVTAVVNQARFDPQEQYDRNLQMLVLLHGLAEEDTLRSIPAAELTELLERDGGVVRDAHIDESDSIESDDPPVDVDELAELESSDATLSRGAPD